jgi:hypothetical protein
VTFLDSFSPPRYKHPPWPAASASSIPAPSYHVIARGNRREAIYREDDDRRFFLSTLAQSCERTGWRVHAWVLNPILKPLKKMDHPVKKCHLTPMSPTIRPMKQFLILLVAFSILTAILGPQQIAIGQTSRTSSSPTPSESEIWKKLAALHIRISDAHADPNAKNKLVDDFVASEGPGIYRELLDRIKDGFYARNQLREVADVMERIKPSPVDDLIARITGETDESEKAMLVYCLGRFDGPSVTAALRKALDDSRPVVHPYRSIESAPWPVHCVSDEAYLALLPKMQKREGTVLPSPTPVIELPRNDKERELRNEALKARMNASGY